MKKVAFIFLLVLSSCSSTHPYRLAVCAMFKNEGPWLKEWLTYHHNVLGVEHFYLYNNESTDDYQLILQPFIDQGIVDLIEWDYADPKRLTYGTFMDAPWSAAQLGAYNDCLKNRAFGKAKWVAVIDIDEFIVPINGVKSFYSILRKAEKDKKGTVSLHWRVFGTSKVKELPEGELLIEKLLYRSRNDHPWNQLVKSIHRPEAIDFCLVHIADKLNPNFGARTILPNQVCIHHYWTRTEQFCFKKRNTSKEIDPKLFEELHQIEDKAMLQYVHLLKK